MAVAPQEKQIGNNLMEIKKIKCLSEALGKQFPSSCTLKDVEQIPKSVGKEKK